MTVSLYTEGDLKAVRRAESVRYRVEAASEAYKALYHSLDAIETEGNAEALRTARQSLCEVNSIIMGQMRDIVDSEMTRIIESEVEIPEAEEIDERIRGLRRDLDAPSSREGLRCCPMCGNPLSWDDVCRFIDNEGVFATVGCECGFSFLADASDSEDWKDSFAKAFNRRDGL